MLRFIIVLVISSFLFIGCGQVNSQIKFDKAKWQEEGDLMSFPARDSMLEDLVVHHQIKGLTYKQVIDFLGEPANYADTNDSIYYDIITNYGYLDPKSGKRLDIGFNMDSIATGFKIVEWHNRHVNE